MAIKLKYIDAFEKERTATFIGPGMSSEGPVGAPVEPEERWRLDDGTVIQLPERGWFAIGVSAVFRYEIDEGSTDGLPN